MHVCKQLLTRPLPQPPPSPYLQKDSSSSASRLTLQLLLVLKPNRAAVSEVGLQAPACPGAGSGMPPTSRDTARLSVVPSVKVASVPACAGKRQVGSWLGANVGDAHVGHWRVVYRFTNAYRYVRLGRTFM